MGKIDVSADEVKGTGELRVESYSSGSPHQPPKNTDKEGVLPFFYRGPARPKHQKIQKGEHHHWFCACS
jgi:hypothetical protein